MTALAPTLQAYFTDRLIRQRRVSPHTIRAYRDTIRLLLTFASERAGTSASKLTFDDLDSRTIGAFLEHLEHDRGCTPRTRNARLAAIRSFYRYAALQHPEHAATIERVLAIPLKRHDRTLVTWLTTPELDALLTAPDRNTWTGPCSASTSALPRPTGRSRYALRAFATAASATPSLNLALDSRTASISGTIAFVPGPTDAPRLHRRRLDQRHLARVFLVDQITNLGGRGSAPRFVSQHSTAEQPGAT